MQKPDPAPHDPGTPAAGTSPAAGEALWRFGSFVIWEDQRRLEQSGRTVRIGPRSFDLLLHLVKRAGEFVAKDELLASVWSGVVVEEASVRVHMSLLRKALGDPDESDHCREWITNVPLRGYRFNGTVRQEQIDNSATVRSRPGTALARPPARLTELVGRDADIDAILESLARNRLVTLVGPGGIGKTTAAIRVAERWQLEHAASAVFADLSPLVSPAHAAGTMARALGAAADLPDPLLSITQRLAGQEVLLLIDNCEHVLDGLPAPIGQLLSGLPGLRILATSREALHVPGENIVRLRTLPFPGDDQTTLSQVLRWPSVELLVERAKAAGAGPFDEQDASHLARISRRLEGIPLAIELVASRLAVQPAKDLATRLDDHMRLLAISNRSASARHRTLAAALDWSIALLGEEELRLLRRLSVFRGRFDAESALVVAAADMDPDAGFDALASLVGKSLVFFNGGDTIAPYRLLDTTRSYAGALLERSGEQEKLQRCHAMFMVNLMKSASQDLPNLSEQAWGDRYAHRLDDVRSALDACIGQADADTSASLITASAPLWFHVSQVAEYRDRVTATLELVRRQPAPDTETATWLAIDLIIALLHSDGSNPRVGAICDGAISGALEIRSPVLELQARWGRCTHDMFRGDYPAAMLHSRILLGVASSWSDPAALNLAHRVRAMASHFCGQFQEARRHCETSLELSRNMGRTRTNMVGVNPVIAAKSMLCRTLWIQGESGSALDEARDAVSRAERTGHAVSLCAALYGACPVALWAGDLDLAGTWIALMRDEARRRGLIGWLRFADWYHDGLRYVLSPDAPVRCAAPSEEPAGLDMPRREMLVTFSPDWIDDALIERVSGMEDLWCTAEVWRAAGWRSERRGLPDDAARFYVRALETARRQGAAAWKWRAALDLARLWSGMDRSRQAAGLLEETCADATAANANPELIQARELLARLR